MATDTEVGGIIAPVKADISDFMSKFDQVNQKANVVSGNLVAKIDQVLNAQQKLNAQGNTFKNNIFESQDKLSDATIARMNKVIVAQEQVSKRSNQLASDIAKNSNTDALVKDVNGLITANSKLSGVLNDSTASTNKMAQAQSTLGNNFLTNNKLMEQMKGHLTWLATGGLVMAAIAAPALAIHSIADVEQQMAGMLQTLPSLYLKTADGIQTHTVNQAALNVVTHDFIGIAARYGDEVDKVVEAGKLWSRGYKDVGDVMKLTGNSTKLAIADMMDVGLANRAVESTISGFKRQGDAVAFSNHVVDSWTNVAHNAQASAADLAESLIRSASAANVVGISFDTVTALSATMIKNTGQSGAIVGNALKSIFSSLDTKKGRAGLEDLGVALYKVDVDGTKHLRNMESVLMDVMIATQGTSKNLQKDIEGIAGGKFQWGRAAALFGDYAEFIKNYNLSIQSAGVADKQVQAQLDTINRKIEQVKANMQGALMGPANAGLGQYVKDWLDSVNLFVKGLQQVPTEVYSAIGIMTKWSVSIYAITKLIGLLSTTTVAGKSAEVLATNELTAALAANTVVVRANLAAQTSGAIATGAGTIALEAEAVAAAEATVATGALGTAVTYATGGMNLIIAAIVAAGIGATVYAAHVGESVGAIEKEKQATEDSIATKKSQLEMNEKQVEFIGTLGNAYISLQGKLVSLQGNEEKTIEIKKDMEATEKELAIVVGDSAAQRILASDDIKGSIILEQEAHREKSTALSNELVGLAQQQVDYTKNQIQLAEDRMDALANETTAWGLYAKAVALAMEQYAGALEKQIKVKQWMQDTTSQGTMETVFGKRGWDIEGDKALLADVKNKAYKPVNDEIEGIANNIVNMKINLAKQQLSGIKPIDTRIGGDEVTDTPDKSKNKNNRTSSNADPTQSIEQRQLRNESQQKKEDLFLQAKMSADAYSTSLDDVSIKEALFGVTVNTTAERAKIKSDRITQLDLEQKNYIASMDELHVQADVEREKQKAVEDQLNLNGVAFENLSKIEKQSIRDSSKEWNDYETTIKAFGKAWDDLAGKSSDAAREKKKIGNEKKIEDVKAQQDEYNKAFQNNNYDKENAVLSLGRDYRKEQADAIELTAAVRNLKLAKAELLRIENQQSEGKESAEYKKQLIVVGQLKNQISTLGDKYATIRTGAADMFNSMAQSTDGFKNFWRNAWMDMATTAINQIWKVKGANVDNTLIGSIFSSLSGGGTKIAGAKAAGGPVDADKTYLVGEKGPELFTPNGNGSIIPNNKLMAASSNGDTSSKGDITHNSYAAHFNPTFVSSDPAANMKQFKQQMPMFKNEIIKLFKTDPTFRNAAAKAVT